VREPDTAAARKARGAFFTPPPIADYFAKWAIGDDPEAKVLDPSCGDGVFLLPAARRLQRLGRSSEEIGGQVFGVDLHKASLDAAREKLAAEGLDARLIRGDAFTLPPPSQLGCELPEMDAVVGNPPYIRYQEHAGEDRKRSASAALAQGVRLSGLASSWAALVVHACAFLKPEGRLAMVLPAELLTVHYAEPVRRWLRDRFAAVHLVMFERLQFEDALEKVVLVVAHGSGGCDSFSLYELEDASDLRDVRPFDHFNVTPASEGKWTDMLLPLRQRQLFRHVVGESFTSLGEYGSPELGTVTGANDFFTLSESTRTAFGLSERHLLPVSPPGTRHLRGPSFTQTVWRQLREAGERVWLLYPEDVDDDGLRRYLAHGEALGVPTAYKCRVRDPWWRPPAVSPPDLFFTYMSHRYPRLIANSAGATFVNSMHGVRLGKGVPRVARTALPLLTLNSVTMLGAELYGRSYGGGVLKMEPREAAVLPVPGFDALAEAWGELRDDRAHLANQLRDGIWTGVVKRVDDVLLRGVLGLTSSDVAQLHSATRDLRARRLGRREGVAVGG
jgi:adenine-specific DNA-methyltransferase